MSEVEAQIIATFLVPPAWTDEMMEEWFSHFLARGDGDGLKDLLFLYETHVLFLVFDQEGEHRLMRVGRGIASEHNDALD